MTEAFLKFLNGNYDNNIVTSFGRVAGGYLSENYSVGDSTRQYFLKKYRNQYSEQDIRNIHLVKKYFFDNSIPVIMPIDTNNGKSFVKYRGNLYALFPFIKGKNIKTELATLAMIKSIAEMQARMHILSINGLPKIHEKETNLWDKKKVLKIGENISSILSRIDEPDEFDQLAEKFVSLKMKLISESNLTPEDIGLKNDHLIHGDYHAHNLFLDGDGEVQYVYDLEKTVNAPRAYELSRAIDYICLNTYDFIKAGAYLRAYREIYPMKDEEFKKGFMFYYLKSIHSFWIEENHYINGNKRTDVFYEKEYEITKYYSKNLNEVIEKIIRNSYGDIKWA